MLESEVSNCVLNKEQDEINTQDNNHIQLHNIQDEGNNLWALQKRCCDCLLRISLLSSAVLIGILICRGYKILYYYLSIFNYKLHHFNLYW